MPQPLMHCLQDGIKLFTYSFYKQRRADVQVCFSLVKTPTKARINAKQLH